MSGGGNLGRAAEQCLALAAELVVLAARARDVALLIAGARPGTDREAWAERTGLVHRALRREAAAAGDLAHALRRMAAAAEEGDPLVAGTFGGVAAGLQAGRARLPGLQARRAEDDHGVRIALLPGPGGPG